MKLFLTLLLIALLIIIFSVPSNAQISLTVTNIKKSEDMSMVKARYKHEWYKALCKNLPDSVKVGTIINASYTRKEDTCKCVFKRYK